ncbi:MAG TPA: hypothetical protein VLY63_07745, partial [Anaerolineae bacterium]|nr:hypothetical protein [Anaerolineae bacterium]
MNRIYWFSGWYTDAYDINDWKQVIGESYWWSSTTRVGAYRAFLWDNGVVSDLGTLGGVASVAYAINDLLHIVGMARPHRGPSTLSCGRTCYRIPLKRSE